VASSQRTRSQPPRYQKAAEGALDQLEWVADYFRRIGKPKLARALDANRASITERAGLRRGWVRRRDDT